MIAAHLSSDPQFAELFITEARLAALLGHPNVVSVLDFDRDEDGTLFLAMELVEGTDLRRLARAHGGPLPVSLALFVAAETLRGLAHAHELAKDGKPLGLVHRDVSPHNILVSRAGGVKVADFGIAKASAASTSGTGHGVIKGKLPYMAPEQAAGQPVDARTDLWAVGIVLHEMLVGKRPFDGATDPETLARVLRADLPPLPSSIPHDVALVLRALLARDREERPASADVAALALRACQAYPPNGEKELGADSWRELYLLSHADTRRAYELYTGYYLSTSGQRYWSDTHQLSVYIDNYHEELDRHLTATVKGSEMITELYVPRDKLAAFLKLARDDFRAHNAKLIYGTIRLIAKDDESFLAWAREPWVCIVMNLHVDHTTEGITKAGQGKGGTGEAIGG